MADINATDLTEEILSTLSGNEQFVMFDPIEGKRAALSVIANYIAEHGEINGDDIPTIITAIQDELTDVKEDINNIANPIFHKVDFRNVDDVVVLSNYNMTRNGNTELRANALNGYIACYLYADKDFDLYFDSSDIAYISFIDISLIENAQPITQSGTSYIVSGINAVYYRKSNSNLPTSESPLHIKKGSCVSITQSSSSSNFLIYTNGSAKELASNVLLGSTQLEQAKMYIESDTGDKPCKIKYVNGSGSGLSTERLEIYIPSTVGYVRYDFVHTIDTSHNANVWRIDGAYAVDDNLVQRFALTTTGEWECAVHLADRDDFSGGYAHGDEILNNITLLLDGEFVNIASIEGVTEFSEINIIQDSDFYDPADHTTVYGKHGSNHIFDKSGVTIKQTFLFTMQETVTSMYMAMLPIAKAVSNMIVPNNNYIPLDTSTARRLYNVTETLIYKTDGNVVATFAVPQFEYLNNNDFKFLCVDNGSTEYNKCYYCNNISSFQVSANKLMKSETKYKFAVSE